MTAPENFRFSERITNSISIRKVPIYDRYSHILEGAYSGKLVRHERAWCYRESVRNCDSDISMWPQPFRWRTITDQCWPGVLRLPSRLAPVAEGLVCPKSGEN